MGAAVPGEPGRTRRNVVQRANSILVFAYALNSSGRVSLALSNYHDNLLGGDVPPNLDDLINADLGDLNFDLFRIERVITLRLNEDLASKKNRARRVLEVLELISVCRQPLEVRDLLQGANPG